MGRFILSFNLLQIFRPDGAGSDADKIICYKYFLQIFRPNGAESDSDKIIHTNISPQWGD
ncbi:MAG: hypothetical protein HOP30_11425 [Cyclobacteriaceae bacterium]|nr:hypothetical protein [Cyclobacteriaceae bacterium]